MTDPNSKKDNTSTNDLLDLLDDFRLGEYTTPELIERADDWIESTFHYFLKFGFFNKYSFLSKKEMISSMKEKMLRCCGEMNTINTKLDTLHSFHTEFADFENPQRTDFNFPYKSVFLSSSVLKADRSRVWTGSEVFHSNETIQHYFSILSRWTEISRGAFSFTDLTIKDSSNERLEIEFIANGETLKCGGDSFNPRFDIPVISKINSVLSKTKTEYLLSVVPVFIFDDCAVISFSEHEKIQLRQDSVLYV